MTTPDDQGNPGPGPHFISWRMIAFFVVMGALLAVLTTNWLDGAIIAAMP